MTSAVVPETETVATAANATDIFHLALPLSAIVESPHNPRKRYDARALEEMKDSILNRGIVTPVLVRHTADAGRFELAAGHRRCRAARMAGLTAVPAVIRHLEDREFLEIMHLENLQRKDVDPLDEALSYEQLLAQGYDVSSLATKLGVSPSYVASRLRLLSLGSAARAAMQLGYVTLSHAIELARLTEARQEQLLNETFSLKVPALLAFATGTELPAAETDAADEDDEEEPAYDPAMDGPFKEHHARLSEPKAPADPYTKFAGTYIPVTVEELRHEIRAGMRRLSVVPWDRADETLVPAAGACATCAKRSGAAPLLFADLDTGDDACLDSECFNGKVRAFQRRQRAAEGPKPKEKPEKQKPVDWQAQQQKQMEAAERARAKAERARAKAQRGRTAALRAVCEKVTEYHFLDASFIRQLFIALASALSWEAQGIALEFLGQSENAEARLKGGRHARTNQLAAWAQDEATEDEAIYRALLLVALQEEIVIPLWTGGAKPAMLEAFGALLRVDVLAIDAAARAEKTDTTTTKVKKAVPAKKAKKGQAA